MIHRFLSSSSFLFLLLLLVELPLFINGNCGEFPAIFNFGDDLSDTGQFDTIFPGRDIKSPYGRTFFGKPAGRYSDGRLVIDFISHTFGLPFLHPYVKRVDANFRHGVNFASGNASAVLVETYDISPISFTYYQLNQFKLFKSWVTNDTYFTKGDYLPSIDTFGKALYTVNIGMNDLFQNITAGGTLEQVQELLFPQIVDAIGEALQAMYEEGARYFWVWNMDPLGCLPYLLSRLPKDEDQLDSLGCLVMYNKAAMLFNELLQKKLEDLNATTTGATLIYLDSYAIMYNLIANATKYGFQFTTRACCGVGGEYNFSNIRCGDSGYLNGTYYVSATSCKDPSSYVNWDGVHPTEAANRHITSQILTGKFFSTPSKPYRKNHDV